MLSHFNELEDELAVSGVDASYSTMFLCAGIHQTLIHIALSGIYFLDFTRNAVSIEDAFGHTAKSYEV